VTAARNLITIDQTASMAQESLRGNALIATTDDRE
jgi:hypothetical protein